MISTARTEKRSRRFIQFAHIKLTYIFAIFFQSLADSKRAFLALPCRESIRRLSASASWESHPRALARTLSSQYHHSPRLSSPPSGAVPDGRIFILRLAESSASTSGKHNSVLRWLCVDNPVDIPEAAAVLPLCFSCSLLFLLDVCTQILSSSALMSGRDAICKDWDGSFFDLLTVPTCTVRLPIARDNV